MVSSCCAYNCKERAVRGNTVTFHKFPRDINRRNAWEKAVRRENFQITGSTKICSKHFEKNCFNYGKLGGVWLREDAVPTKFDFSNPFKNQNQNTARKVPYKCLANPEEIMDLQTGSSNDSLTEATDVKVIIPPRICHVHLVEDCFAGFEPLHTGADSLVHGKPLQLPKPSSSKPDTKKVTGSGEQRKERKYFLGDFADIDMLCPDNARRVLEVSRDIVSGKSKSIRLLKRACNRYENQIASLAEQLRLAKEKLRDQPRPNVSSLKQFKKQKLCVSPVSIKNETMSVDHAVSANLELELKTGDSASDHEIKVKEEPMSDSEDTGVLGYQNVHPTKSPSEAVSGSGVSNVRLASVYSVASLAKPSVSSGEILGMPVGDLPMRPGILRASGMDGSNGRGTNGVLVNTCIQSSSSPVKESGEDTRFVSDYRTRDQFDAFGEYIASKLRSLDWRTGAYVQKVFSDIIFQAETGNGVRLVSDLHQRSDIQVGATQIHIPKR